MLAAAELVAFVPSTDLARSRAFYEGVLGLEVTGEDGFAVVLRVNGVTVRVSNVGEQLRPQVFTVLGWSVADAHAEIAELVGRGVQMLRVDGIDQDDAGVWAAPGGSQVAWFKDPDGNTLSIEQPA